jgi:hypothetical protein
VDERGKTTWDRIMALIERRELAEQ